MILLIITELERMNGFVETMKSLSLTPTLAAYNSMLEANGKAGDTDAVVC